MRACIAELQAKGYGLPDYPEEPGAAAERATKARYDRVKGSAVNPVLRQGNSDRRAPRAVKDFARANPPRLLMWPEGSKTHVSTMGAGDFRDNEDVHHTPGGDHREDRARCGERYGDGAKGVTSAPGPVRCWTPRS